MKIIFGLTEAINNTRIVMICELGVSELPNVHDCTKKHCTCVSITCFSFFSCGAGTRPGVQNAGVAQTCDGRARQNRNVYWEVYDKERMLDQKWDSGRGGARQGTTGRVEE